MARVYTNSTGVSVYMTDEEAERLDAILQDVMTDHVDKWHPEAINLANQLIEGIKRVR